jgi:hypothetical protein
MPVYSEDPVSGFHVNAVGGSVRFDACNLNTVVSNGRLSDKPDTDNRFFGRCCY